MRAVRRTTLGLLVCAMTAALAGAPGGIGQERVPGTIRVQVTLVPVDVIVTDKDDRPITDLRREDFTVLENGVRQTIAHFSFQALAPSPTVPGADKPLLRKIPAAELTPGTRRTFLIVLGRGRLQEPSHGVDGLLKFVREDLLPQDLVAVLAYNRATDFTTDHEKVVQVLERFRKYHEGIEAKMALHYSGLAAIYAGREIPKSLQPDIAKVFDAPGAIGAREVPPGRVTDAGQMDRDTREVTDALQRAAVAAATGEAVSPLDTLQADALTDLPFDEFVASNRQTMQDVQNLYTAIEYLRYMEGEKHLLFFTENGLFLPRLENDKSLAAMANDARVAIDTFQTGGVAPPPDLSAQYSAFRADAASTAAQGGNPGGGRGAQPLAPRPPRRGGTFSQMFALSSLRNISRLTGGRASIHADVPTALARLNDATRAGYLLGYYPRNGDFDGKYRAIVVRVNRPDARVYFRRGYYARQTLQPFDRRAFLTYSRIAAAAQYEEEVKDLAVKAKAAPARADGGTPTEVQIDVRIDPARVPFVVEAGVHRATLQVTTFYGDGKGRFLGELWQELNMNLLDATWQKVQKEGITFATRVPLQVPDQTFKIVVYSYEADRVGSTTTRLK
jgi:VWFA-related protein